MEELLVAILMSVIRAEAADATAYSEKEISRFAHWWLTRHRPQLRQPVTATLTITNNQGDNQHMPINTDTVGATATVEFKDSKGNVTAAPDGAVVAFSSDNPAVLAVSADATNPLVGDLAPATVGTANIAVTINDAAGSPILEADGVTPFAPAAAAVPVGAGAAASASLVIAPA